MVARPPLTADKISKKDYDNAANTGQATEYDNANVINVAKTDADIAKQDAALKDGDPAEYQRLFLAAGPGDNQGRLHADNSQRPKDNDAKNAEINAWKANGFRPADARKAYEGG